MIATHMAYSRRVPVQFVILIVLAVIGFGLSVYLTQHYYELRSGTAAFKSICNLGQKLNCDAVAASSFAEVVPGVPLSSFTAGWYLSALILYLFGALSYESRKEVARATLVFNLVVVIVSAAYLIIMAAVLQVYCLFCLIMDAINLISLGLAFTLRPESLKKSPIDRSAWRTYGWILAGSIFVCVVAFKGMDNLSANSETIDELAQQVLSTPAVAVNAGDEFPSIGPRGAPVTIVEFSDFQCPFCRIGAKTLNTVLARFPKRTRLVFRNYPLDMACNRLVQHPMHTVSCEAAKVGVCANKQGKFEPYYEEVFENQTSLSPGNPPDFAKRAGADPQSLSACASSAGTAEAIQRDIDEGTSLGVTSTPTFFINGHKMEGLKPLPVWTEIIQALSQK